MPRWLCASLAVLALGLLCALPAGATTKTVETPTWTKIYNGPGNGTDSINAMATSSTNTVLVAGASAGASPLDIQTFAYNGANGAVLWKDRLTGPADAYAVAFSPDGTRAFVTGDNSSNGGDFLTRGFNASTGAVLWTATYDGPGHGVDSAQAVTVSPNGNTVYVTGPSNGSRTGQDYATIAYSASTGALLWGARYDGTGHSTDVPFGIAVSPDGSKLFVTGDSTGTTTADDMLTVAYNASTGAQLWATRMSSTGANVDFGAAVTSSPDSGTVYVTGTRYDGASGRDWFTVAQNATTGAVKWAKTFKGNANLNDNPTGLALTPDGTKLVVAGVVRNLSADKDWGTVAYNAATGAQLWSATYNGPASTADIALAVAVNAAGTRAYVVGASHTTPNNADCMTRAYGVSGGSLLWTANFNTAGVNGPEDCYAVAPHASSVYVAGYRTGATSGYDFLTLAYPG